MAAVVFLSQIGNRATSQTITRLSVHRDGTEAYPATPYLGAALVDASADGRFVLYRTSQTGIVGPTAAGMNLLLLDRAAGITILVANGNVFSAAVSNDGNAVVFIAKLWRPQDGTPVHNQVYRFDTESRVVVPISLSDNGEYANNNCQEVVISGDGQTMAFTSLATNLGENVLGGNAFGYVYRTSDQELIPVTHLPNGDVTYVFPTSDLAISPSGDRIVFTQVSHYRQPPETRGPAGGAFMLVDLALGSVTLHQVIPTSNPPRSPRFCDDDRHLVFYQHGHFVDQEFLVRFDTIEIVAKNIIPAQPWYSLQEPNFDGSNFLIWMNGASLAVVDLLCDDCVVPILNPIDGTPLVRAQESPRIRANSDLSQIIFASDQSTMVERDLNNASDLFILDILASSTRCLGDVNGSGSVGMADIMLVLRDWGSSPAAGDANGDGAANFEDIWYVLSWWGTDCP